MTSFATARDGTRICWTSQGAGDAVLLAMGASFSKEFWFRVAPVLAQHYRVLTFDNRGFGETAWNGEQYTLATLADDAVAVLDAAGVDRAHVYGVSLGGGTVQELALRHPERVRSLILGCTTAKDSVTSPAVVALFRLIPRWLLQRVSGNRLYGTRAVDPALAREDQALIAATKVMPGAREAQTMAIALTATTDRLGAIRVPTLVIHGTADRAVPYQAGVRLAGLIPGAKLVTLEGSGHSYVTDATEEANQAVLDFLAAVSVG